MDGWLLGFVRVLGTGVDLQLGVLGAAEGILRKHAPDGVFNEEDGTALTDHAWGLDLLATDVSGETGVDLVDFLGAGEADLVGVDDDDEVTGVDMRREDRLVLAAQKAGGLNGDQTEDLVLGVDDIPVAHDFVRLGGKRFHGKS